MKKASARGGGTRNLSRVTTKGGTYFYDTAALFVAANVFGTARRQDLLPAALLIIVFVVHLFLVILLWINKQMWIFDKQVTPQNLLLNLQCFYYSSNNCSMLSHSSLHGRDAFVVRLGVLVADVDLLLLLFAIKLSRAQDARDGKRQRRARLCGRRKGPALGHPPRGFHLGRLNSSR